MTIETDDDRAQYATNGTAGPWTVPFYFLQDADLYVVYADAAGVETALALSSGYTVTGAGNPAGGTVTTTTAYAAGGTITILRDIEPLQEADYVETDSFPAASHERALDKLTMLAQMLIERSRRAITFSGASGPTTELSTAGAGKLVAFNDAGTALIPSPVSVAQLLASLGAPYVGADGLPVLSAFPGVDPTGAANSDAGWLLFIAVGGGLIDCPCSISPGLGITSKVKLVWGVSGRLIMRTAGAGSQPLLWPRPGAEHSDLGNPVLELDPALYALWTSLGNYHIFNDWCGLRVDCPDISAGRVHAIGWVNYAVWGYGDRLRIEHIHHENCASGSAFGWQYDANGLVNARPYGASGVGQFIGGATYENCGNLGIASLQHSFDTYGCKASTYRGIKMIDIDGGAPGATGRSAFLSGLTDKLSEHCTFEDIEFISPIGTALQHLAMSMLGSVNCTFSGLRFFDFAGLGLEMLTCYGNTVTNFVIDGNYRSGVALAVNVIGVTAGSGRYDRDSVSRSGGSRVNNFSNGIVTRVGQGWSWRAGYFSASNVTITGCIGNGNLVQKNVLATSFPASPGEDVVGGEMVGCTITFNGGQGIVSPDARSLIVRGCNISNNGQNSALVTTSRSGLNLVVGRAVIEDNVIGDDQTFSNTSGASFKPGAMVNDRIELALYVPYPYMNGQYVALLNAGGPGVHHTVKVVNYDGDLMTVEKVGGATFSSSGNTAAISGTWTGGGPGSRTLTGVGGAANTEVAGTVYVTDGTNSRRVEAVTGANTMLIAESFPASLTGTALFMVRVTVQGIPSQQLGSRLAGSGAWKHKGNTYKGNVVERMQVSVPVNGEVGSDYFRRAAVSVPGGTNIIDFYSDVPAGHRMLGYARKNTAAISGGGATRYDLLFTEPGGATIEQFEADCPLALDDEGHGNCVGGATRVNSNRVRAVVEGGNPTAGQITLETMWRVDGPPALT